MKKFLGILVLGLLWCNVGVAKDLTGIKLFCNFDPKYFAFDFISEKRVKYYSIITSIKWDIRRKEAEYYVTPTQIRIKFPVSTWIHRETLHLSSWGRPCTIMDKDWSPELEFNSLLEKMLKEQESKNKI